MRDAERLRFLDGKAMQREQEFGELRSDGLGPDPVEERARETDSRDPLVAAGPVREADFAGLDAPPRLRDRKRQAAVQCGKEPRFPLVPFRRPRVPGDPEHDPVTRLDDDAAEALVEQAQRPHLELREAGGESPLEIRELVSPPGADIRHRRSRSRMRRRGASAPG